MLSTGNHIFVSFNYKGKQMNRKDFEEMYVRLSRNEFRQWVEQYAEEMCKKQREICANKAYPVLNHGLFRDMQDEIRTAPLATEENK